MFTTTGNRLKEKLGISYRRKYNTLSIKQLHEIAGCKNDERRPLVCLLNLTIH